MSTTNTSLRVRFAPSPTGHLHIGGLRTALFNWLFAQHNQGIFLLRIEDTDLERSKPEYTQAILEAFSWVNILPDEPIVVQSHRFEQHRAVAESLIRQGKAYRCYCDKGEHQEQEPIYKKYEGTCRTLRGHTSTQPHVVRFKIPEHITNVSWNDLIRDTISFSTNELDDFVILRSDGIPTYNFVVVVDDAFMRISHVIRGEDHISNTPKQILLYQACDYPLPQFGHVSMILGPSGNRLSKRDAATSVLDYRDNGYLPDALLNYLVRLGWAHGDQEIFTREELVRLFSLQEVGKKSAIFDQNKLDWMNSMYMRAYTSDDLYAYIQTNVIKNFQEHIAPLTQQQVIDLITLYKERTKTVRELAQEIIALKAPPLTFSPEDITKWIDTQTPHYLHELIQKLEALDSFTVDLLTDTVKVVCNQLQIKLVQLAQPIRLALVGKTSSPGVFELLAIFKKAESIQRLRLFLKYIEKK